jgi:arylesterase/paraoxonase
MAKSKLKIAGLATGLVLALVLGYLIYIFIAAGQLRPVEPHFDGDCTAVGGLVGAEDITFQPSGRLAYISSDDRRATIAGKPRPGAIFGYYLDGPGPGRLVNLTPSPPPRFHPHGISLVAAPDEPDRLLVVNHPGASLYNERRGAGPAHTVELFELQGGRLVHRRTFSGAALVSPNDVAAVAADRFYVTNDHGSTTLRGHKLEDYLRLRRSNVVYFDGQAFSVVARDLRFANGVALGRDGTSLFVAATTDSEVVHYHRLPDGRLRLRRRIALDTGPDNIEVDAEGNLWIGAHPRLLTFLSHASDATRRAPSEVVKLVPDRSRGYRVEQVLMSRGEDLSASSVAARHGSRLLLGAVFDPRFLDCTMNGVRHSHLTFN